MLGSAVSSNTPSDFQPKPHIGPPTDPVMKRYTYEGPPAKGCTPVGMQRALDSAIGLPRRSTKALAMLTLVMPLEVRRILMRAFLSRLHLVRNRSFPPGSVIPELAYADVVKAGAWLCEAFGFRERLRIGTHRVQLVFGDGAIVAIEGGTGE